MRPHLPYLSLSAGVTTLALLAVGGTVFAAPPRAEEIANPEITASEVTAHLKYLASPDLSGRGSGTAGNDQTAEYLAERFSAAGLKPAGENGTYFQSFKVFTGIKPGPGNALLLKQGKQVSKPAFQTAFKPLVFSSNGAATGPLFFAGYGISKPDLGHDDYKGVNVKGKVVVVLRHTPDNDPNGKLAPFASLLRKTMTAREKGAAGVLLVTGPLSEKPEDLGDWRGASDATDAGIPAATVKASFIEKLLAPTQKTVRDVQVMIAHGQNQSFPIPNATATLKVDLARQQAPTRNVIGMLEGSDPRLKDEYVVVGAHYDHLGMGGEHSLAESREPSIHFGADDNASGTTGVLELAQYFAANRSWIGRSILFMGYSGEEIGLLGSAHWTKQPTVPLPKVVAMLNMDMIGRLRNDSLFVVGAKSSPAWDEILAGAGKSSTLKPKLDTSAPFGGSDQQSFYIKEIPVLFFFTGIHTDYHRPTDTWDKINVEGEVRILKYVADVLSGVSKHASRPAFVKLPDAVPSQSSRFRVFLGTIPDYGENVEGVALSGVRTGGPAEKAGVRAGDILVEIAGRKIRNVQEYTEILGDLRPNVPVKLVVLRKQDRLTLSITPAARAE